MPDGSNGHRPGRDETSDDALRDALRDLAIPDHGPDFAARRREALTSLGLSSSGDAALLATGGAAPSAAEGAAQSRRRRTWLLAAAAAVVMLGSAATAFLLARSGPGRDGGVAAVPTPVLSRSAGSSGGEPTPQPSPSSQGRSRPPQPVGDDLRQLAAGSDGSLWAFGTRWDEGGDMRGLVERWSGSEWTEMPAPQTPAFMGIGAVLSDEEAWAVGDSLFRWDGLRWTPTLRLRSEALADGLSVADLVALDSTDVWSVGYKYAGQYYRDEIGDRCARELPVALHWDGKTWSETELPAVEDMSRGLSLRAVAVVAADDVWAAGDYQVKIGEREATPGDELRWIEREVPYLVHWDGTSWTRVTVPGADKGSTVITDIAVTRDGDLWLVGHRPGRHDAHTIPIVLVFRHGEWRAPNGVGGEGWEKFWPSSVVAVSSRDVWIGTEPYSRPQLRHWNGVSWEGYDLGDAVFDDGVSSLVAVSGNEVWGIVGAGRFSDERKRPYLIRWDGVAWRRVETASYPETEQ